MATALDTEIDNLKSLVTDCYDAVEDKGGTRPSSETVANLPTAIDGIPKGADLSGYTFVDGSHPSSVAELDCSGLLTSVIDNDIVTMWHYDTSHNAVGKIFNSCTLLTSISLPNLEEIHCSQAFAGCTNLKTLELPKLKVLDCTLNVGNNAWFFRNCNSLVELNLPSLEYVRGDRTFEGITNIRRLIIPKYRGSKKTYNSNYYEVLNHWYTCPTNLIDIVIGENITGSFKEFAGGSCKWSPTNALLSDSTSLVDEGESFASNLEKLLYNIREHIAANLPTTTSGYTFSFASAVYNAISESEETVSAFTDKGWTIASV